MSQPVREPVVRSREHDMSGTRSNSQPVKNDSSNHSYCNGSLFTHGQRSHHAQHTKIEETQINPCLHSHLSSFHCRSLGYLLVHPWRSPVVSFFCCRYVFHTQFMR